MSKRRHGKKGSHSKQDKSALVADSTIPATPSPAPKQFRFDLNFWFGIVGVVGTVLGIVGLWLYFSDKKTAAFVGKLNSNVPANHLVVAIGDAKFVVNTTNGVFLVDGTEPLVWFKLDEGKLLVSADFRNEKGELIAELRENQWKLNKQLIFDRNYTDSAFGSSGTKRANCPSSCEFGRCDFFRWNFALQR